MCGGAENDMTGMKCYERHGANSFNCGSKDTRGCCPVNRPASDHTVCRGDPRRRLSLVRAEIDKRIGPRPSSSSVCADEEDKCGQFGKGKSGRDCGDGGKNEARKERRNEGRDMGRREERDSECSGERYGKRSGEREGYKHERRGEERCGERENECSGKWFGNRGSKKGRDTPDRRSEARSEESSEKRSNDRSFRLENERCGSCRDGYCDDRECRYNKKHERNAELRGKYDRKRAHRADTPVSYENDFSTGLSYISSDEDRRCYRDSQRDSSRGKDKRRGISDNSIDRDDESCRTYSRRDYSYQRDIDSCRANSRKERNDCRNTKYPDNRTRNHQCNHNNSFEEQEHDFPMISESERSQSIHLSTHMGGIYNMHKKEKPIHLDNIGKSNNSLGYEKHSQKSISEDRSCNKAYTNYAINNFDNTHHTDSFTNTPILTDLPICGMQRDRRVSFPFRSNHDRFKDIIVEKGCVAVLNDLHIQSGRPRGHLNKPKQRTEEFKPPRDKNAFRKRLREIRERTEKWRMGLREELEKPDEHNVRFLSECKEIRDSADRYRMRLKNAWEDHCQREAMSQSFLQSFVDKQNVTRKNDGNNNRNKSSINELEIVCRDNSSNRDRTECGLNLNNDRNGEAFQCHSQRYPEQPNFNHWCHTPKDDTTSNNKPNAFPNENKNHWENSHDGSNHDILNDNTFWFEIEKHHHLKKSENKAKRKKVSFDQQNEHRHSTIREDISAGNTKGVNESCDDNTHNNNIDGSSDENGLRTILLYSRDSNAEGNRPRERQKYYKSNITVYDGLTHKELLFVEGDPEPIYE